MSRRLLIALIGAAALAAAPGLGAAATVKAKPKRVTIGVFDNYYSPSTRLVKVGTTVRWHWDDNVLDEHDVHSTSVPKGAKKLDSGPLAAGQTFSRVLTRPGTYKFVCTFHQDMKLTVTVKR